MLMVCLFICLTKRTVALSWKTRIWHPQISKGQLTRLFLQLQGDIMQCNRVFVGSNRKLEMNVYILRQEVQQLLAFNGKKTKPNPERQLFNFALPQLARERITLHCVSHTTHPSSARSPALPAAAAAPDAAPKPWRGCSESPPLPRVCWQGAALRKLTQPPHDGRAAERRRRRRPL